jgi:hypothetical protein
MLILSLQVARDYTRLQALAPIVGRVFDFANDEFFSGFKTLKARICAINAPAIR